LINPSVSPSGTCPVHPGERVAEDPDVVVLPAGLLLGETHARYLWVRKSSPRDDAVVSLRLHGEEGVTQRRPGLVFGDVGEEVLAGNVPGSVDVQGGGAEVLVYLQALFLQFHARVLQRQAPGGGAASCGNQYLLAPDFQLLSLLVVSYENLLATLGSGFSGLVSAAEGYAVGHQDVPQDLADLGVLLREG
jgi:hypothetical protein